MRLLELIICLAGGSLFLYLGWRIWKREEITLVHDYHWTKVKEEDKKPYTARMGKAMLLMGAGICLTGCIDIVTRTLYGWAVFGVCFGGGLILMVWAQIQYNHGIF